MRYSSDQRNHSAFSKAKPASTASRFVLKLKWETGSWLTNDGKMYYPLGIVLENTKRLISSRQLKKAKEGKQFSILCSHSYFTPANRWLVKMAWEIGWIWVMIHDRQWWNTLLLFFYGALFFCLTLKFTVAFILHVWSLFLTSLVTRLTKQSEGSCCSLYLFSLIPSLLPLPSISPAWPITQ